jgi:methylase of polypeptide subunit release factors
MSSQKNFKIKIKNLLELNFCINDKVFLPTGTSEFLVNTISSQIKQRGSMLDLGCGVGLVGISLAKLGLANFPVYFSDLSEDAAKLTIQNSNKHNIDTDVRVGPLYEPWKDMSFDYIIDDVSGISEEIAKISPWFQNVPCASGLDGTDLVIDVLKHAPLYLKKNGKIFFPVLSLSNTKKILDAAYNNFKNVKLLARKTWLLPAEMLPHLETIRSLTMKNVIQVEEKFGMILWYTEIYEAHN